LTPPFKRLSDGTLYSGPDYYKDDQDLRLNMDTPKWSHFTTVDVETISLKDNTAIGVGFAIGPNEAYYVPILPDPSPMLPRVIAMLSDQRITKTYHNAVFDLLALRRLAIEENLPLPDIWNVQDTALMARITGHKVALEDIGNELLGHDDLFSVQDILKTSDKAHPTMLDVHAMGPAHKCINDVLVTWEMYEYFSKLLTGELEECYEVDRELLCPVLKETEEKGLLLRPDRLESHRQRLTRQVNLLRDIAETRYGFNPGSPQQVGYILASQGDVLPLNRGSKKPSLNTSEDVIKKLSNPIAHLVLGYRKANKLLSTYVTPWIGEERAYTHFKLDLETGRLASFDRNLQNIPPSMRDIFAPDDDEWTYADMSQVEMRGLAYISKDPVMLQAYKDNQDIHAITQQGLWPGSDPKDSSKRGIAKTFNFAMVYYGTTITLAEKTGMPYQVCEDLRQKWLHTYPVVAAWMQEQFNSHHDYVTDIFGRRMMIRWDLVGKKGKTGRVLSEAHVRRTQVNYPVQASAASINKRGFLMCNDWGMDTRLQIHDEFLWNGKVDVPQELDDIHPEIHVPFEAKQGEYWIK